MSCSTTQHGDMSRTRTSNLWIRSLDRSCKFITDTDTLFYIALARGTKLGKQQHIENQKYCNHKCNDHKFGSSTEQEKVVRVLFDRIDD